MTRLRHALPSSAVALTCAVATLAAPAVANDAGDAAGTTTVAVAPRLAGSLTVDEKRYVGGQAVTWHGNIGARGVRTISLELNISRVGDEWTPVDGFSTKTAADGDFRFRFPAPAMANIRYRVVAPGRATPAVEFNAKSQDLTLELVGGDTDGLHGRTEPATPFTLEVDTTPQLARRPDTIGLPAFPGRTVTLQRRTADRTWETVGTDTVNAGGTARFTGLQVADAGVVVYRARQENFTEDGNRIGWFPSFPYYVYVGQDAPTRGTGQDFAADGGESGAATATAAQRFGWGRILYDFGWLRGESLTSPPQRGTEQDAYWLDWSDGAGRAATRNGGLELVSSRVNDAGPGDFGTTYATINRAAQKYGRWELRMRSKVIERGQDDYRMVAQLVPDSADVDDCARTITIAEVDRNGTRLTYGANAGSTKWRASRTIRSLDTSAPAFAVEVTPTHVTWFMDGKVIGVVRSRSASSDQPMTLRVGIVGAGQTERNHTSLFNDWVRSFPLGIGKQATRGPALTKSGLTGC